MKTLLVLLGLAAGGFAQNTPPRPVIQGTVVEFGTNRGLAGAQVLLTGDGIDVRTPPHQTSDSQGNFRFELEKVGHYNVTVQMEGYRAMANFLPASAAGPVPVSTVARVVLTTGYPSENLQFILLRTAELTGRVVDAETGQPVAKTEVAAVTARYLNGQLTVGLGVRAMTDDDGQVLFAGLVPGKYLIETLPRKLGAQPIQTQFSAEDLKLVDQDYERSYWPGGTDAESASPIPVSSGGSVSAGTLKPRKVPYYRIHAIFPATNCRAGDYAQVILTSVPAGRGIETQAGQVSCGQDFLIRNVQPGSYRLTVYSGLRQEARVQSSQPVEVTDKNLEMTVSLARGLDLEGKIVAAEGAGKPPLDKLVVFVQPVDFSIATGVMNPDLQGGFHVVNAALGRQIVSFSNLGNFYIKEVRYNGLPVAGNIFVVDGSAGQLEVVLDDKPASIGGVIEDDGNAVSKPYVVLTSWPMLSDGMLSSLKNVTGDASGKFRFAGLPPGDYRVLAVPQTSKDKLDEPGVLNRLLSGAESVTVGPAGSQDLRLKVVDPSR